MNNLAWLDWMETLMGGGLRFAATLPPDRYHCVLDELPLHLVPRNALTSRSDRTAGFGPWRLNPACTLCDEGQLPDFVSGQRDLLSGFAVQGTIAWVRNAVTSSVYPFWLGPKLEHKVRELQSSGEANSVSTAETRLLLQAGVLIPAGEIAGGESTPDRSVEKAADQFRRKGYAPLPQLIHPYHVAALRRYYRYLIRTGAIRLGDGQSPLRYVAYNEPVARFFHHQLAGTLSVVAGEPVKPSYVYLASYLAGAELKKHTDREQCEFSITLCLDFSPEPALETSWPIQLDTPDGQVTVYQCLGDGLAYRGTRLPHYRDHLPQNKTSTSIFFHYVPSDFTGSLD